MSSASEKALESRPESAPFRYFLRVRYGECDAQKVVFNARYGDYVDLASTEFINAIGYRIEMADGSVDYQLVKQTMEWKAPARFGDALEIRVRTLRVGTTSFALGFEFSVVGREGVSARCETVYVLVDPQSLSKRKIGALMRERLERGAAGQFVDHAGLSLQRAAT